jgi:hypothetical protein
LRRRREKPSIGKADEEMTCQKDDRITQNDGSIHTKTRRGAGERAESAAVLVSHNEGGITRVVVDETASPAEVKRTPTGIAEARGTKLDERWTAAI